MTSVKFSELGWLQGVLRETYSGSEVVLVAELIKLVFSGYLVLAEKSDTGISYHEWFSC